MNSDAVRAIVATGVALAVSGCTTNALTEQTGDLKFGDANRHTMRAQVIDPDPVYTNAAQSSGAHAADAVERYRTDKVKQPDAIRTTDGNLSQPQLN